MSDENLPVKTDEDFFAEAEKMDLSALRDEFFLVAVSNGDRNKSTFVSTTVRGPLNFAEMAEDVGKMWEKEQHHAKVVLCTKERNKAIKTLDANTVDYIECYYKDIIMESFIEGTLSDEYTCRAGIVEDVEEVQEEKPKQIEDATK